MSPSALDQIAPGLAASLHRASDAELRRIATAASELALERRPVTDARIVDAMEAVHEGSFGPSTARDALAQLVQELDEEQWALDEALDDLQGGFDERGRPVWLDEAEWSPEAKAKDEEQEAVAERARAANSLLAALDEHALVAADEALYQAHGALGEESGLLRAVIEPLLPD